MSVLDICTCEHEAFRHHFSGYLGTPRGQDGRGKCAVQGSRCQSYHQKGTK